MHNMSYLLACIFVRTSIFLCLCKCKTYMCVCMYIFLQKSKKLCVNTHIYRLIDMYTFRIHISLAVDATSAKKTTPLGPRATEDAVLNVSDMAALDEFGSGTEDDLRPGFLLLDKPSKIGMAIYPYHPKQPS